MLDWIPIIQKGAEALAPELFKAALKTASKAFQDLKPYTVLNFEDNFAISYRRCTKIKTIVDGDVPVDLLSSYINLSFTNKSKEVDDYGLIETIWDKRNIVVSGPAGCGKSMFMKYLWIACFVRSRGKIPLFIELRQLNDVDFEDLRTFLFHSCASNQQKDARSLFDKAIEEGQFFFILDGFDELIPSKAVAVEKEVIKLSNVGKNIVVVSGRPDDRFGAWAQFLTYRVAPLKKDQVIALIDRIEFNQVIKKKFTTQIRRNLYDAHKDFISRPLLATMMLLTYSSFAEIPSRIHVFYDQAFDTLFSRHDATKEAFKRQRYTNFEIYEFKKIFGIFCLITYIEQMTEFTESTVREFIKRAGIIAGAKFQPDAFLKDIMNSVCVLQRDGLSIVFSHRSFQEYFCAYSFLKLSNDEARQVAPRLGERTNDNVMPMLLEMNKSFLEDVYFVPMINLAEEFFSTVNEETEIRYIVEFLECGVAFQLLSRKNRHREKIRAYTQIVQGNKYYNFIYWLSRMYGDSSGTFSTLYVAEEEEIDNASSVLPKVLEDNVAVLYDGHDGLRYMEVTREPESGWTQVEQGDATKFLAWLGTTRFSKMFRDGVLGAKRIIEELRSSRAVHQREVLSLLRRGDSRD